MPTLGTPELLIILVIIIFIFGLGRLPQVGRGLGQMIRAFRQNVNQDEPTAPEAATPAAETQAPDEQTEGEVSLPAAGGVGLKEALQEVLGLFQGPGWKAVEAQLVAFQTESRDEHQALLAVNRDLQAQVSQLVAELEQVKKMATPEELSRWQAALKKLRLALVAVIYLTADAAYEPVVQNWLVPETIKKLEQLKTRIEGVLAGQEPLLPQFEFGQMPTPEPSGQPPEVGSGVESPTKEIEPPASPPEAPPEIERPEGQPESELPVEQKSRRLKRPPWEPEMIIIPAGKCWLGTDRRTLERADVTWRDWIEREETPRHQVYLPEYAIGRYPVTNAEYARFIEAGGYRQRAFWSQAGWQAKEERNWTQPRFWTDARWNQADCPVVGVSWYEGVAYCRWLSQATGRLFRLPSEAEWEKAARGPEGRLWPWGNTWDPNRCNSREKGPGRTTPVGLYSPAGDSYYGVADMAGNVWEWCATKWQKPYPYDVTEDEWHADYLEGTDVRVLRGGSWINYEDYARCPIRRGGDPSVLYAAATLGVGCWSPPFRNSDFWLSEILKDKK